LAPARTAVVERCCTLGEARLSKLVLAHYCTLGEGHCYIPVGELSYIPAWELVLPHCCTLAWARFGIAPWGLAWGHFCTLALAHCCTLAWAPAWRLCCTAVLERSGTADEGCSGIAGEGHCCTVALAHSYILVLAHSYIPVLARLSIPVSELVLQHCCTLALGPGDKQEQQLRHTHPKLLQSLLRSLHVLIRRSRHWNRRWTRHRKAEHSRRPRRTRCCRPAH
jgi:hypothetical protein